jgi:hypothetical protein
MPSPLLLIRRIVVDGKLACDIAFDVGLNILLADNFTGDERMTNKAGKTALVELIGHAFGRQQNPQTYHFAPITAQLGNVYLEIQANDATFTIQRSLHNLSAKSIVRQTPYFDGIASAPGDAVERDELSAFLLHSLGIPQVKVKTAAGDLVPLSFPTIMRSFILHQDDSFGRILDKVIPDRRVTDILGFLTRIVSTKRFEIEKTLGETQTTLAEKTTELDHIEGFLQKNGVPALHRLDEQIARAHDTRDAAEARRRSLQEALATASPGATHGEGGLDTLRRQLLGVKADLARNEAMHAQLEQQQRRIGRLGASLRSDAQKVRRIQTSQHVLSTIDFAICPRCLLEITPEMRHREDYGRCTLCNRAVQVTSDQIPKNLPRSSDIQAQIEEATSVGRDLDSEIVHVYHEIERLQEAERRLSVEVDREAAAYVSPSVDSLVSTSNAVAEATTELNRLLSMRDQALHLDELRATVEAFRIDVSRMDGELREAKIPARNRIRDLRRTYDEVMRAIDFPEYRAATIDPDTLLPAINGDLYVHVGTALRGLAVLCYHLALLQDAIAHDTFFPRILVVDSPAVGDLNDRNHDLLLRYLASVQKRWFNDGAETANEHPWQIILTTRRILPELEPFVVRRISAKPGEMLLRPRGRTRPG